MDKHKRIIIINGKGGSGKDTIVSEVTKRMNVNHDVSIVLNISSITPVNKIMDFVNQMNVSYGHDIIKLEKTDSYRKLLSLMKQSTDEYFDLSFNYIMSELEGGTKSCENGFLDSNRHEIVCFIHIRETENIDKFVQFMNKYLQLRNRKSNIKCDIKTMIVTSPETDDKTYGNKSDDNVKFINRCGHKDVYMYDINFANRHQLGTDEFSKDIDNLVNIITEGM